MGAMPAANTNLYLVGFMGTGKTTVGRTVAMRLGYAFLDSDHEIERQQGRTVAQIFADKGEAAFRAMEQEFIQDGHPTTKQVVSCGGGLVVQPGKLELLNTKVVVICLHASLDTILRRTSGSRHRPLLDTANPMERIRTLYAEREPVYRLAGSVILTDGRSQSEVVQHVLRSYKQEARDRRA